MRYRGRGANAFPKLLIIQMVEMENMGEGKDLAQMSVHRDGKKWIRFAKCFYMNEKIYQEGIN